MKTSEKIILHTMCWLSIAFITFAAGYDMWHGDFPWYYIAVILPAMVIGIVVADNG